MNFLDIFPKKILWKHIRKMEGLMIRMLELVHCVEAEFGVGVKGLKKGKKSKKTYSSKAGAFVTQC